MLARPAENRVESFEPGPPAMPPPLESVATFTEPASNITPASCPQADAPIANTHETTRKISLLISKSHQRIALRRANGGDIACGCCDDQQCRGDCAYRQRVTCRHTEQQATKNPAQRQRGREPYGQPD